MSDPATLRRIEAIEKRLADIKTHEHTPASGTFTPTFVGTSTAGSFTYVAGRQDGRYTMHDTMLIFGLEVAISAIAVAPVGSMTIAGLPFAAAGSEDGTVMFGLIANINMTAAALMLTGFIASGTSVIDLREMFDNAGSTAYPAANFTNVNAQLRLTGVYWIA